MICDRKVFKWPLKSKQDEGYDTFIKGVLIKYEKTLGANSAVNEWVKNKIHLIVKGIIEAIEAYYEGSPHEAYKKLKEGIINSDLINYIEKDHVLDERKKFYRIRLHDRNFALSKEELFHIPFQKRGLIRPQRYSIHGTPCLYLSNSSYCAWEEMHRPRLSDVQIVKLENVKNLKVVDLTFDRFRLEDQEIKEEDLLLWPLIAACSVKIKDSDDIFRPEYIIPQLFLEWVNKEKVDGIKFSSTKNYISNQTQFHNFVFPVKKSLDQGHCSELKGIFQITEVLPFELSQIVAPHARFSDQSSISYEVNDYLRKIEIIPGKKQNYAETAFGIIEHKLDGLDLEHLK